MTHNENGLIVMRVVLMLFGLLALGASLMLIFQQGISPNAGALACVSYAGMLLGILSIVTPLWALLNDTRKIDDISAEQFPDLPPKPTLLRNGNYAVDLVTEQRAIDRARLNRIYKQQLDCANCIEDPKIRREMLERLRTDYQASLPPTERMSWHKP